MNNNLITITNFLDPVLLHNVVCDAMELMPVMDSYDNEWEPKLILAKEKYSINIRMAIGNIYSLHRFLGQVYNIGEFSAHDDYFTGFFVYRPRDFLQNHLDSTISPTGNHKAIVTNLYLNACAGGNFVYDGIPYKSKANTLLAFPNHNESWHSVTPVTTGYRIVLTVGFLGYREDMTRQATKAYFAPNPGENWLDSKYKRRDERAGLL